MPNICGCGCGKICKKRFVHGHKLPFKTLAQSFSTKYEMIPECGCWIWVGSTPDTKMGYGEIKLGYKKITAHRASWIIHYGPIPTGMCVLHRCDIPSCVNPHHLFLGTKIDNNNDKLKKNRQSKGSQQGIAKLTETQVIAIRIDNRTQVAIAKHYGVHQTVICRIKNRKAWMHI